MFHIYPFPFIFDSLTFRDRHGNRFNSFSTIWAQPYDNDNSDFPFEEVVNLETHGATDWEFLIFRGKPYLFVSEEGDIQGDLPQASRMYHLLYSND